MGLIFPDDLMAWQRWQRGRHGLRAARDLLRRPSPPGLTLHLPTDDPVVLFALEASTPTAIASVTVPLKHLGGVPAAVVAPFNATALLPGTWRTIPLGVVPELPTELGGIRAVVASGHFLPAGAVAYEWSRRLGARFLVVQHGLMTPFAPPLPHGAHLLAFSERDGDFWRSGRTDVTADAIGSQLLWEAARHVARTAPVDAPPAAAATPVFLGQLHGAELPRRISGGTAVAFCRRFGAEYRPHPAEVDRISRLQHALWRRRGIRFAPAGGMLDRPRPVVSIFSTGVLEAAAGGVPSWVTCLRPPAWVQEFWERYELAVWGGEPTPAPLRPEIEPARAVAERALAVVSGEV